MNDFEGLLSTDYGFKPSGKSAPMAAPPPKSSNSTVFNSDIPRSKTTTSSSSSFRRDQGSDLPDFDDVFSNLKVNNSVSMGSGPVNYDSIFGGGGAPAPRLFSSPNFDKPLYDDDVSSSPVNYYDDIFTTKKGGGGGGGGGGDDFDELLGGLGKKKESLSEKSTAKGGDKGVLGFDDLLPGFGGISSINRSSSDATKKSSSVLDNPFVVLESTSIHVSSSSGISSDPLEKIGNLSNSDIKKFGNSSSVSSPERGYERKVPVSDFGESPDRVFEMPSVSSDSSNSMPNASSPVCNHTSFRETYSNDHVFLPSKEKRGSFDEIWLTVSEIPLSTQPTAFPPPSRPPPPRPGQFSRAESGSFHPSNAKRKVDQNSSFHGNPFFQSPKIAPAGATSSFASPLDDLDDFAAGINRSNVNENSNVCSGEDFETSAAAMKEAMDRTEVEFRYAKGAREKENSKVFRSSEFVSIEKEEDDQDREFREGQDRLIRDKQLREREREREEEEERRQREEEERRRREEEEEERRRREEEEEERRQREEEERRRIEKEREEKEREKRRIERERELARLAVERAAREARERAAIEALTRAERAAVQKANSEARERAQRAAVQRAQREARERAAADAKERAAKAAAKEREKARYEAREKEAREKAATASRVSQQNEPDVQSFFGAGSRASSAPRPRATSPDPFDSQFQSKPAPKATKTSVNSTSSMRKASPSTSIFDNLTSIFGEAPSSSGDFQEIDGEPDERRRARLESHQRTQERAAKALAEMNARELDAQREQAERHRISETLDVEIKRWAAGKEGNLRALLSTLQYVLWPECGWQPVSLTDLITGASVKKVYRKATLCIHPDKVQQKGANLQQKYVAEKVFDMLKEAWNKFNSEELF